MFEVDLSDLRIGDEVVKFDKSWTSTDFLSHRVLIHDESVIERLKQNGVRKVFIKSRIKKIDTEKSHSEETDKIIEKLRNVEPEPMPDIKKLKQASKVYSESLKVVSSVLADVKSGKMFNTEATKQISENIADMTLRDSRIMTSVTKLRQYDNYTFHHSINVSIYAASLAAHLGMGRTGIEIAANSGLVHDIGKMFIPDNVINKPGKLTEEEFALVKNHVEMGCDYLKKQGLSNDKLAMVAEHHERYDGTGYPANLKDKDMTIFGKIGAVVDIYDAMTSDRIYHKGVSATSALRYMFQWTDTHINKSVFEFFVKSIGIYPVGSIVQMRTKEIAMVAKVNNGNPLTPVLVVFMDRYGSRIPIKVVDLSKSLVATHQISGLMTFENVTVPDDVVKYVEQMYLR